MLLKMNLTYDYTSRKEHHQILLQYLLLLLWIIAVYKIERKSHYMPFAIESPDHTTLLFLTL